MSRHQALKQWHGKALIHELAARGILVRSASARGVAEEAPLAYKDVGAVVDSAHRVGAWPVASLDCRARLAAGGIEEVA
jgi:tRNA-splicing ligase RtcB